MVRESRHVKISNIPVKFTEDKIRTFFTEKCGRIQKIELLKEDADARRPGESLSAVVSFVDIRTAAKAMDPSLTMGDNTLSALYIDMAGVRRLVVGQGASGEVPQLDAAGGGGAKGAGGPMKLVTLGGDGGPSTRQSAQKGALIQIHETAESLGRIGISAASSGNSGLVSQLSGAGKVSSEHYEKDRSQRSRYERSYDASNGRAPSTPSCSGLPPAAAPVPDMVGSAALPRSSSRHNRSKSSDSSGSSRSSSSDSASSRGSNSHRAGLDGRHSANDGGSDAKRAHGVTETHMGLRPELVVKNLPFRSADASIKDGLYHKFKKLGKVVSVKVVGEGESRYAIVLFRKFNDIEKIMKSGRHDDNLFLGSKIQMELAPPGLDVADDNEKKPLTKELDEYHPHSSRTLYIGNLDNRNLTSELLRSMFAQCGEVLDVNIKNQNTPAAFAFIQYADIKSVVKAIRTMDAEYMGNHKLKLGFGKSLPSHVIWLDELSQFVMESHVFRKLNFYGQVKDIVIDRDARQALVYFENVDVATKAVVDMKGRNISGKRVQVDFASRELQDMFLDRIERMNHSYSLRDHYLVDLPGASPMDLIDPYFNPIDAHARLYSGDARLLKGGFGRERLARLPAFDDREGFNLPPSASYDDFSSYGDRFDRSRATERERERLYGRNDSAAGNRRSASPSEAHHRSLSRRSLEDNGSLMKPGPSSGAPPSERRPDWSPPAPTLDSDSAPTGGGTRVHVHLRPSDRLQVPPAGGKESGRRSGGGKQPLIASSADQSPIGSPIRRSAASSPITFNRSRKAASSALSPEERDRDGGKDYGGAGSRHTGSGGTGSERRSSNSRQRTPASPKSSPTKHHHHHYQHQIRSSATVAPRSEKSSDRKKSSSSVVKSSRNSRKDKESKLGFSSGGRVLSSVVKRTSGGRGTSGAAATAPSPPPHRHHHHHHSHTGSRSNRTLAKSTTGKSSKRDGSPVKRLSSSRRRKVPVAENGPRSASSRKPLASSVTAVNRRPRSPKSRVAGGVKGRSGGRPATAVAEEDDDDEDGNSSSSSSTSSSSSDSGDDSDSSSGEGSSADERIPTERRKGRSGGAVKQRSGEIASGSVKTEMIADVDANPKSVAAPAEHVSRSEVSPLGTLTSKSSVLAAINRGEYLDSKELLRQIAGVSENLASIGDKNDPDRSMNELMLEKQQLLQMLEQLNGAANPSLTGAGSLSGAIPDSSGVPSKAKLANQLIELQWPAAANQLADPLSSSSGATHPNLSHSDVKPTLSTSVPSSIYTHISSSEPRSSTASTSAITSLIIKSPAMAEFLGTSADSKSTTTSAQWSSPKPVPPPDPSALAKLAIDRRTSFPSSMEIFAGDDDYSINNDDGGSDAASSNFPSLNLKHEPPDVVGKEDISNNVTSEPIFDSSGFRRRKRPQIKMIGITSSAAAPASESDASETSEDEEESGTTKDMKLNNIDADMSAAGVDSDGTNKGYSSRDEEDIGIKTVREQVISQLSNCRRSGVINVKQEPSEEQNDAPMGEAMDGDGVTEADVVAPTEFSPIVKKEIIRDNSSADPPSDGVESELANDSLSFSGEDIKNGEILTANKQPDEAGAASAGEPLPDPQDIKPHLDGNLSITGEEKDSALDSAPHGSPTDEKLPPKSASGSSFNTLISGSGSSALTEHPTKPLTPKPVAKPTPIAGVAKSGSTHFKGSSSGGSGSCKSSSSAPKRIPIDRPVDAPESDDPRSDLTLRLTRKKLIEDRLKFVDAAPAWAVIAQRARIEKRRASAASKAAALARHLAATSNAVSDNNGKTTDPRLGLLPDQEHPGAGKFAATAGSGSPHDELEPGDKESPIISPVLPGSSVAGPVACSQPQKQRPVSSNDDSELSPGTDISPDSTPHMSVDPFQSPLLAGMMMSPSGLSPSRPSLEERIKALDEKFNVLEKAVKSVNKTAPSDGSASMTTSLSKGLLAMSTSLSSAMAASCTTPYVTTSAVDYTKYTIKKKSSVTANASGNPSTQSGNIPGLDGVFANGESSRSHGLGSSTATYAYAVECDANGGIIQSSNNGSGVLSQISPVLPDDGMGVKNPLPFNPSTVLKSTIYRSTIFDQDIQRLAAVEAKYTPGVYSSFSDPPPPLSMFNNGGESDAMTPESPLWVSSSGGGPYATVCNPQPVLPHGVLNIQQPNSQFGVTNPAGSGFGAPSYGTQPYFHPNNIPSMSNGPLLLNIPPPPPPAVSLDSGGGGPVGPPSLLAVNTPTKAGVLSPFAPCPSASIDAASSISGNRYSNEFFSADRLPTATEAAPISPPPLHGILKKGGHGSSGPGGLSQASPGGLANLASPTDPRRNYCSSTSGGSGGNPLASPATGTGSIGHHGRSMSTNAECEGRPPAVGVASFFNSHNQRNSTDNVNSNPNNSYNPTKPAPSGGYYYSNSAPGNRSNTGASATGATASSCVNRQSFGSSSESNRRLSSNAYSAVSAGDEPVTTSPVKEPKSFGLKHDRPVGRFFPTNPSGAGASAGETTKELKNKELEDLFKKQAAGKDGKDSKEPGDNSSTSSKGSESAKRAVSTQHLPKIKKKDKSRSEWQWDNTPTFTFDDPPIRRVAVGGDAKPKAAVGDTATAVGEPGKDRKLDDSAIKPTAGRESKENLIKDSLATAVPSNSNKDSKKDFLTSRQDSKDSLFSNTDKVEKEKLTDKRNRDSSSGGPAGSRDRDSVVNSHRKKSTTIEKQESVDSGLNVVEKAASGSASKENSRCSEKEEPLKKHSKGSASEGLSKKVSDSSAKGSKLSKGKEDCSDKPRSTDATKMPHAPSFDSKKSRDTISGNSGKAGNKKCASSKPNRQPTPPAEVNSSSDNNGSSDDSDDDGAERRTLDSEWAEVFAALKDEPLGFSMYDRVKRRSSRPADAVGKSPSAERDGVGGSGKFSDLKEKRGSRGVGAKRKRIQVHSTSSSASSNKSSDDEGEENEDEEKTSTKDPVVAKDSNFKAPHADKSGASAKTAKPSSTHKREQSKSNSHSSKVGHEKINAKRQKPSLSIKEEPSVSPTLSAAKSESSTVGFKKSRKRGHQSSSGGKMRVEDVFSSDSEDAREHPNESSGNEDPVEPTSVEISAKKSSKLDKGKTKRLKLVETGAESDFAGELKEEGTENGKVDGEMIETKPVESTGGDCAQESTDVDAEGATMPLKEADNNDSMSEKEVEKVDAKIEVEAIDVKTPTESAPECLQSPKESLKSPKASLKSPSWHEDDGADDVSNADIKSPKTESKTEDEEELSSEKNSITDAKKTSRKRKGKRKSTANTGATSKVKVNVEKEKMVKIIEEGFRRDSDDDLPELMVEVEPPKPMIVPSATSPPQSLHDIITGDTGSKLVDEPTETGELASPLEKVMKLENEVVADLGQPEESAEGNLKEKLDDESEAHLTCLRNSADLAILGDEFGQSESEKPEIIEDCDLSKQTTMTNFEVPTYIGEAAPETLHVDVDQNEEVDDAKTADYLMKSPSQNIQSQFPEISSGSASPPAPIVESTAAKPHSKVLTKAAMKAVVESPVNEPLVKMAGSVGKTKGRKRGRPRRKTNAAAGDSLAQEVGESGIRTASSSEDTAPEDGAGRSQISADTPALQEDPNVGGIRLDDDEGDDDDNDDAGDEYAGDGDVIKRQRRGSKRHRQQEGEIVIEEQLDISVGETLIVSDITTNTLPQEGESMDAHREVLISPMNASVSCAITEMAHLDPTIMVAVLDESDSAALINESGLVDVLHESELAAVMEESGSTTAVVDDSDSAAVVESGSPVAVAEAEGLVPAAEEVDAAEVGSGMIHNDELGSICDSSIVPEEPDSENVAPANTGMDCRSDELRSPREFVEGAEVVVSKDADVEGTPAVIVPDQETSTLLVNAEDSSADPTGANEMQSPSGRNVIETSIDGDCKLGQLASLALEAEKLGPITSDAGFGGGDNSFHQPENVPILERLALAASTGIAKASETATINSEIPSNVEPPLTGAEVEVTPSSQNTADASETNLTNTSVAGVSPRDSNTGAVLVTEGSSEADGAITSTAPGMVVTPSFQLPVAGYMPSVSSVVVNSVVPSVSTVFGETMTSPAGISSLNSSALNPMVSHVTGFQPSIPCSLFATNAHAPPLLYKPACSTAAQHSSSSHVDKVIDDVVHGYVEIDPSELMRLSKAPVPRISPVDSSVSTVMAQLSRDQQLMQQQKMKDAAGAGGKGAFDVTLQSVTSMDLGEGALNPLMLLQQQAAGVGGSGKQPGMGHFTSAAPSSLQHQQSHPSLVGGPLMDVNGGGRCASVDTIGSTATTPAPSAGFPPVVTPGPFDQQHDLIRHLQATFRGLPQYDFAAGLAASGSAPSVVDNPFGASNSYAASALSAASTLLLGGSSRAQVPTPASAASLYSNLLRGAPGAESASGGLVDPKTLFDMQKAQQALFAVTHHSAAPGYVGLLTVDQRGGLDSIRPGSAAPPLGGPSLTPSGYSDGALTDFQNQLSGIGASLDRPIATVAPLTSSDGNAGLGAGGAPADNNSAQSAFQSLVRKYPIMWQGCLALKNDTALVQMHFIAGNRSIPVCSLPRTEDINEPAQLRIAQRMRLEPQQLDGVERRMQHDNEHCILLALPCGRDQSDIYSQQSQLETAFIHYLQQKQAAGIVNVMQPEMAQPSYVIHIFPPCEFAENHLSEHSEDFYRSVQERNTPYLLIVVATVQ